MRRWFAKRIGFVAVLGLVASAIAYLAIDRYLIWPSSRHQLSLLERRIGEVRCPQAPRIQLTRVEDALADFYYLAEIQADPSCIRSMKTQALRSGFEENRPETLSITTNDGDYLETLVFMNGRPYIRWTRSKI